MLRRNLLLGFVLLMSALGGAHAANVNVTVGPNGTLTFSPSTVTINAGDTVTFKNAGGFHNVSSNTGLFRCAAGCDGAGGNGNVSSALWTAVVTFNNAGTFGYFCEQHGSPGVGMAGSVVVNGVAANPDFAIAPDSNTLGLIQGSEANAGITLTPQNGFSGNVTYSVSGLPTGVTASFSAASATREILLLTATGGATTGSANVQVQATSGNLSHTTSLTLNVTAASAFTITPGITGSWYNPVQSGHGFNLEVAQEGGLFVAYWYVWDANGHNYWLYGVTPTPASSNTVTLTLSQTTGGTYPPLDKTKIVRTDWGSLTLTFADCDHGTASWAPTLAGFTAGTMPIQRVTHVVGVTCP
jgi:plastocyanin